MDVWRVEVIRGDQTLLLKRQDVTVSRLARIFKIKPNTLYLEEDVSMNAEFPDAEGQFNVSRGVAVRYKVCGDEDHGDEPTHGSQLTGGHHQYHASGWAFPRPWAPGQRLGRTSPSSSSLPGPSSGLSGQSPSLSSRPRNATHTGYTESCFKRTIPYVTLVLDDFGKIVVDSTIDNVYLKIPESSISVSGILSSIGEKIADVAGEDLVLLDAKLFPISDADKELDYWKTPSRRFYAAKHMEYENLLASQQQRKRLATKKRKAPISSYIPLHSVDDTETLDRIETTVVELKDLIIQQEAKKERLKSMATQALECKICKQLPVGRTIVTSSCCNQILGCTECIERVLELSMSCPLCRSEDILSVPLKGLDDLLNELNETAKHQ